MARDNKQRIRVFGLEGAGNVTQALLGEEIGTMVSTAESTSPSDDIQSRISIKPTILKEQTMATIVDQAKAQMAKSVESTRRTSPVFAPVVRIRRCLTASPLTITAHRR